MNVEYRDIPGFPGYRVGSDGSVWSWVQKRREWKILAGGIDKDGYRKMVLCNHGLRRYARVQILVLEEFRGPCPEGMEACHTDDPTPANNRLDNLRWDTHERNIADKKRHGTHQQGEKHGCHKLTDDIVRAVRRMADAGARGVDIAKAFDITPSRVWFIVSRRQWKHVE